MAQILDRETIPLFLRLIPSELKTKICLPGTVVIGEMAEGPEGDEPAGVLVLTLTRSDEVSVEWLWVEEELQGEGLGESLLMIAFDIARADQRRMVTAKIYNSGESYYSDGLGATYFMERHFFHERNEELWALTGEDLAKASIRRVDKELCRPFLSGKQSKGNGERAKLSFLPVSKAEEKYLRAAEGIGTLYTEYREMIDRDLSFVCMGENACKGALLVVRMEDSLSPVCFRGDSTAALGQLLIYSLMELKDALDDGKCFLTVEAKTPEIKTLLEKLFPKARTIPVTVLSADPDVPETERKLQEEDNAYWERVDEEKKNWPREFVCVGTEFLDGSYVSVEEAAK